MLRQNSEDELPAEHPLALLKAYIKLERKRADLESDRVNNRRELGRTYYHSAKFCCGNASSLSRDFGVTKPYHRAARYAREAVSLLNESPEEIEDLVDACLEVSVAYWFIDEVSIGQCVTWCERALLYLDCVSSSMAVDRDRLAKLSYMARKNRALYLHYQERYSDSIAAYRALLGDLVHQPDRSSGLVPLAESCVEERHIADSLLADSRFATFSGSELSARAMPRVSDDERFTLMLQLSNVLLDTHRVVEAFSLLADCDKLVVNKTADQKLRILSSRSLAYQLSGDMSRAIDEIHSALAQYFESDESLNVRGNLLLRAARFHVLVGDTEQALGIIADIELLGVSPVGAYFELNKCATKAMASLGAKFFYEASEHLAAFREMLQGLDDEGIEAYWMVYFELVADLKVEREGNRQATDFLKSQTGIAGLTQASVNTESYPLLLKYCELAVGLSKLPRTLESEIQLLLFGLGYADVWERWRVLSLAALYSGKVGTVDIAIRWAKLACLDISTLNAPLYSSASQRDRLTEKFIRPFEVLEYHLVCDGQVPQAHSVRRARQRIESYWRYPSLRAIAWPNTESGVPTVPLNSVEIAEVEKWHQSLSTVTEKLHNGSILANALEGSNLESLVRLWTKRNNVAKKNLTINSPVAIDRLAVAMDRAALASSSNQCLVDYWSDGKQLMASVANGERWETMSLGADQTEVRKLIYQCRNRIYEREEWYEVAQTLYQLLIEPIEGALNVNDELKINPCDALRYLPFAALHDGSNFLVEHVSVSYQSGRTNHMEQDLRESNVLFLGTNQHSSESPGLFPAAEMQGIAKAFPIRESLTNEGLDRLSLAGALPKRSGIVHLCNHYEYLSHQPEKSRLLLSEGRELSLQDLFDDVLDWTGVGFLFLGVCNSGVGALRESIADPVSSLSLAELFLSSGVLAVVATFDPVLDAESTVFSTSFYARLRTTGSVSRALQEAQIQAISQGSVRWPLYGLWR